MAKIRRVFPGGNTSKGFYSLHDNIMGQDRNMLYILKGMPGGGKSSLMKELGDRALQEGYTIEYHHCPSDPTSIDGVVITELGVGIIDGTPPHGVDPLYPGLSEKIIDLGQFIDEKVIKDYKENIIKAKFNNKQSYRKAFNYFKSAKLIYDEIVETNKQNVDFYNVNRISKDLINKIFDEKLVIIGTKPFRIRELFSSAYTPTGFVDYTSTILKDIKNKYYISGEIGNGKSTLLSRIVEEAKIRNYHLELYYNAMFPDKLESVIIFELDTIISTNPTTMKYEHILVDFKEFMNIDLINVSDNETYKELIDKGIKSLYGAKENHFILENCYKKAVNYEGVNNSREYIWNEIMEMKNKI